jgi:hypothetical protein
VPASHKRPQRAGSSSAVVRRLGGSEAFDMTDLQLQQAKDRLTPYLDRTGDTAFQFRGRWYEGYILEFEKARYCLPGRQAL